MQCCLFCALTPACVFWTHLFCALTPGCVLRQAMGIFCLEPRRVAITGKVRAFALDKTGTLTQAWLDFLAVQPARAVLLTSNPRTGESTLKFEVHVCMS